MNLKLACLKPSGTRKQLRSRNATAGWLVALSSITAMTFVVPVQAAEDYYKQGCEHYAKGDYESARHLFEHINTHAPSYAPAHYQLGNTYLKLNRLADARISYEKCIQTTKDPTLIRHCQTAIAHIMTESAAQAAKALKVSKAIAETTAKSLRDEDRKKRYDAQVAEVEKQRSAILKEASDRARRIRDEMEKQVAAAAANTNQRLRNTVTGERSMGLTEQQEKDIRHPYEQEVETIMRIANDRARVIRMPAEPVYEGPPPTPKTEEQK
jgi:tetratricopeptide (TPR) repeat protein